MRLRILAADKCVYLKKRETGSSRWNCMWMTWSSLHMMSSFEILLVKEVWHESIWESCHIVWDSSSPKTKKSRVVPVQIREGCFQAIQNEEEQTELLNIPYQSFVGALMWLAVSTCPDIAHAVSVLSQYNTSYGKSGLCGGHSFKNCMIIMLLIHGALSCCSTNDSLISLSPEGKALSFSTLK